MEYLRIKEDDRILIIAPHPDDECIGVGGLLLLYPRQCSVWVLTDGCIGQGNDKTDRTKQVRHNEFIAEMEYLEIKEFCFFDIPDGTLIDHTDCLNDKALSDYTKIFVTGAKDGHSDHMAAFLCVMNAVRFQHIDPQIYEYEIHSSMPEPTHMLDITELMERKKILICFHGSQLLGFPYDGFAEIAARYRAMQNRMSRGYLEVYRHVRDLNDELSKDCYEAEIKLKKQLRFYQLLTKWMNKRNKGRFISDFLEENSVHTVSIYGYAELGRLTVDELMKSDDVTVSYAMDKKVINDDGRTPVIRPSKQNPSVDSVIVTAINSFEEIRDELELLGYEKIYSLEEVIDKI